MTDADDHRRAPPAGLRSAEPIGRTARFVDAVRDAHGDAFVRSWLSPATCQFDDCVVWTYDLGARRINEMCGPEIIAHRVVIKCDVQSRAHFRAQATTALDPKRKSKRRGR